MGDNKERKELSQPYTYIRKHTHVHIEYTLKVSEPKVHLSVEILCANVFCVLIKIRAKTRSTTQTCAYSCPGCSHHQPPPGADHC